MSEAAAAMRERLFTMRMSSEESDRLEAVAKHYALNAAGVIRMLVKREFDTLTVPAQAPPAPEPPRRSRGRKVGK